MKRVLLAVAGIGIVAGCTNAFAPLAPGPYMSGKAVSLMFTATVSKTPVHVGDTASLIFTLRNPTTERVTLDFATTCQITGRVRRGRGEVWPRPYFCADAVTHIVLDVGVQRVVTIPFTAISSDDSTQYPGLALTPAAYVSYAELENNEGRSTSVDFTIVK